MSPARFLEVASFLDNTHRTRYTHSQEAPKVSSTSFYEVHKMKPFFVFLFFLQEVRTEAVWEPKETSEIPCTLGFFLRKCVVLKRWLGLAPKSQLRV